MPENPRLSVPRWARLGLLVLVPVVGLVAFLWSATAGKAAPVQAGTPTAGGTAIEYVERIDQTGSSFVGYGYVTYVNGLDSGVLFTNPASPGEATARMTFYATGQLTARSVISNVFVLNTAGPITFYFNSSAGASFSNPASFKAGTAIAGFDSRNQNITNVQSPNAAVGDNFGDMTQTSSIPFSYSGSTYALGRVGLPMRSFFTGEGTRTNPASPDSFFVGGGNITPIGYQTQLPIIKK